MPSSTFSVTAAPSRSRSTRGLERHRAEVICQKHKAILKSALIAFLEFGYDRTTVDYVAQQAEVSKATLYKHFTSKADLFGGIVTQVWRTDRISSAPVPIDLSPQTALMNISREYAQLLTSPHILQLFRVIIAEAPRFPELGTELYHRGKEPFLKRLKAYLQAQIEVEKLVISDTPIASSQLLGMISDIIFCPRFLSINLNIDKNGIEKVITSAVQTFLARYEVID